jgi:hypothetical protein
MISDATFSRAKSPCHSELVKNLREYEPQREKPLTRETPEKGNMSWDQMKGKWMQIKGAAKTRLGKTHGSRSRRNSGTERPLTPCFLCGYRFFAERKRNTSADYSTAFVRHNFEITAELVYAFAHPGQSNSKFDAVPFQLL